MQMKEDKEKKCERRKMRDINKKRGNKWKEIRRRDRTTENK